MIITVAILGDQLQRMPVALAHALQLTTPDQIRIVLVESLARLHKRRYQAHKVIFIVSALRHYAAWLRDAGWQVDYYQSASWRAALTTHVAEMRPQQIITMAGAEYAARQAQARWQEWVQTPVTVLPNSQFLSAQFNPLAATPAHKRTVMESFYRAMRQHFVVLVDDGAPCGGAWNLDAQNRKPLPKGLVAPTDDVTSPDAVTTAVCTEVATWSHVVGDGTEFGWAVTHADAEQVLDRFIRDRLPWFGDYEDAMSHTQRQLFHSLLSPYLNVGLLEPMTVIRAAEAAYRAGHAPLNAVEGFIRQILGWREYMYLAYWRHMPHLMHANAWQAERPVPAWFWPGATSGMHCMDTVIARVWQHGYTHHIERLMILSNFCVLAGIDPVAVNHWFLAGYIDAYDWVMWPNVSGMGLNADGGLIATKPYIASATYINKMSDFCAGCQYSPTQRSGAQACPFTLLYWNFLLTHETRLRANPRMGPAVLGVRHLADAERVAIRRQATIWLDQWVPSTAEEHDDARR